VTDIQQLEALFPGKGEVPAEFDLPEPIEQRSILIGGKLAPWDGPLVPVISPIWRRDANGVLGPVSIGGIPDGDDRHTDAALAAAVSAYDQGRGAWPTMSVAERIGCVEEFTRKMLMHRGEVTNLLMWEIAKSRADSEKEFDRTVEYIRATITALKSLDNDNSRFVISEGTIGQIRRTPLGVVLCIGPYNYPLNETFTTLIPALIMGNTVVFKPPRYGVLFFSYMMEAMRSAFPPGVINMVYGRGEAVIPRLMESGKIDVLTMIGSSRVAGRIKKMHPKVNRLRAILGLDAKNAAIVLPDADLDLTVKECLAGSLSFNGQRCTALKMLIVHRSIVDEFIQRFSAEMGKLKLGMPWDKGVNITPLPEPGKIPYLNKVLEDAKSKGARVMNTGGGLVAGSLFSPTLLYPVRNDMMIYREEQFGPLVPIMPFDELETALEYVVTSEHGQQVSIFSSNAESIGKLVDPLVNQVCRVNINCQCQRGPDVFPFTGRKDSAEGTLSVSDALRSFSIRSMVATKQTSAGTQLLDKIVQSDASKFINTRFIF
jgi:aldehyde dehydrogenase (NAD+)